MAEQTRTTLKGYFNTGDIPTESQFVDLIDSVPNITDDAVDKWTTYNIYNDSYVPANNWVTYGSGGETWSFTITHDLGTIDFIPSFKSGSGSISPLQDWNVLTYKEFSDWIQSTYSPLTLFNVVVNTSTIMFVVTGSATKPEIIFTMRLLKV